ncbi:MAG: hypothetical protein PF505_07750 [Vallitaleaceae bacterium]|jgi:hypothetical protein|nr:hypothetical protein [Vallitaleaceae bacterium]
MKKQRNGLSTILFYGAIWGIIEATLGYVLHLVPTFIAGLIMFPIASFILVRVYRVLGSRSSILYVGLVAAAIKSVDFFLPELSVFKTLNPMVSIIVEAMIVMVVYPYLVNTKSLVSGIGAVMASLGWRAVFVLYMYIQFIMTGNLAQFLATPADGVSFVVISGTLSACLLFGAVWLESKKRLLVGNVFNLKPVIVGSTLLVALIVTYVM